MKKLLPKYSLNLDERFIKYLILSKLHLTQRGGLKGIAQVIRDNVGIHASRYKSPFFSLLARLDPPSVDDISHQINYTNEFIKIRCMRGTLHISTNEDLSIFHQATLESRMRSCSYLLKKSNVTNDDFLNLSKSIINLVSNDSKSLVTLINELNANLNYSPEIFIPKIKIIVRTLWEQGILGQDNMLNTWQYYAPRYTLLKNLHPELNPNSLNTHNAKSLLIKRYFMSYGPATITDAAWWAGLGLNEIKEILSHYNKEFVEVTSRQTISRYIIHVKDLVNLKLPIDDGPKIRLLAYEDNLLKAYKITRDRFVDPRYNKVVYNAAGEAVATILFNDRIIGTWTIDLKKNVLIAHPFIRISQHTKALISYEVERLSRLLRISNITLLFR